MKLLTSAREYQMKDSTKDKIEGTAHELKGKIKEKTGQVTNNPALEDEGTAEKIDGKVQKKVGDIEKVVEK
jgi:uncharacterized protein YjbJ (UPF0337 family)